MWFVSFAFNLDPALGALGLAGGVVHQHQVGGATKIAPVPPQPNRQTGPGHEPPDILEAGYRNFVIDAGGVRRQHQLGGAWAILVGQPPRDIRQADDDDELETWLLLNDYDPIQAELNQEEHALV